MMRNVVIGVVAVASAMAGVIGSRASEAPIRSVSAADVGCPEVPAAPAGGARALASGGVLAVAGGKLVAVDRGSSFEPVRAADGAQVRHVASAPGYGTAYVVDRRGNDLVVVSTPDGTRLLRGGADASHPTWSPSGDLAWATGSGVAVLRRRSGQVARMRGPVPGGVVFSPAYASSTRLVVVVAAPPGRTTPHGGSEDTLWTTPAAHPRWRALSDFRTDADRWVAVRTPISDAGTIRFVRISGRASATREPSYELWELARGEVRRVRSLPGERYLAGSDDGRLLWNVPDPGTGRDMLVEEGPSGLRPIGCGSVMTDPLDSGDPDRRGGGAHVPARGDWPELAAPAAGHVEQVAIIVGDFATAAEADTVVNDIHGAYAGSTVEVVDAASAPSAIRPGVFGALLHLPIDADATSSLATFRARLPQYATTSWVVTP